MRRAVAFGIVVLSWCIAGRSAGAQHGVLAGQVLDAEANAPLPFAGVSIVGQNIERLSDDAGRFRFTDLAPGTMRLRVRRVGYAPLDTPLVIRPNDTTTVVIHLTHIAVRLAAVQVHDAPCTLPGAPAVADATLAAVFRTADAQRRAVPTDRTAVSVFSDLRSLLQPARHWPIAQRERLARTRQATRRSRHAERHDDRAQRPAVEVQGRRGHRAAGVSVLGVQYGVAIPTLAVFADPEFIKQHCFQDAGEVASTGQPFGASTFAPRPRSATPISTAAIFLDTATFVIRRSADHAVRALGARELVRVISVDTFFDELLPGVPVIVRTNGRSVRTASLERRRHCPRTSGSVVDVEEQHVRQTSGS